MEVAVSRDIRTAFTRLTQGADAPGSPDFYRSSTRSASRGSFGVKVCASCISGSASWLHSCGPLSRPRYSWNQGSTPDDGVTCGGRRRERRSAPPRVPRPGHGRERGDTPGRLRGVAGEREGLAAAAAEIELATRAARARLLHPRGAAERIEGRRVRPDIGERMLAHVPEFKAGNRLGRVAGQHLARRRHVERAPAPAADARLGIAGIVVRHHRVDDDAAVVTRAQVLHRRRGPLDLLAASASVRRGSSSAQP